MNKSLIKKFSVILLAFCFILSLTACSSNSTDSPSETDSNSSTSSVDFPTKPITVINPYKAGGSGDLEVKAMQPAMEELFGVSIVTEYLTTGGGTAAVEKVAKAKPDGYTLLYINNPAAIINELTENVQYKTLEDFDYLMNVSTEYRVIATLSNNDINSVDDIISKCKSGETISIAHSGIGSSGHLQITLLEKALGIDLNDVPFEGNSPAKAAVLGGHVDLWAIDAVSVLPLVKSGELKVIAINAPERHKELPDVPTFKELGYEGVEVSTSRGYVAPKGLPEEVKEILIDVLKKAVESDGMKSYVEKAGSSINSITGDDYYNFTKSIYESIEPVADLIKQ